MTKNYEAYLRARRRDKQTIYLYRKLRNAWELNKSVLYIVVGIVFVFIWIQYIAFYIEHQKTNNSQSSSTIIDNNNQETFISSQSAETGVCNYPDFIVKKRDKIISGNYELFDLNDPTLQAGVGNNLFPSEEVNFTVIYNLASPTIETNSEDYDNEINEEKSNDNKQIELDEDHITFVTHSTVERIYPYLIGLLTHWKDNPISLSIFAPGTDFCLAWAIISWFWTCKSQVRNFVSFHVIIPTSDAKEVAFKTASEGLRILDVNCNEKPNIKAENTHRVKKKIPYPINVARNVARLASETKYFLNSNIEFNPSPEFPKKFLEFLKTPSGIETLKNNKSVYVIPTFEIAKGLELPKNKKDLIELIKVKKADYYQKDICSGCYKFPFIDNWLKNSIDYSTNNNLKVFKIVKAQKSFIHWTPVYIGTNSEPYFDEKFTWEGLNDKILLYYELCLVDYSFVILDNCFLVYKSEGKTKKTKYLVKGKEKTRIQYFKQNSKLFLSEFNKLRSFYKDNGEKCGEQL